jgi:glycerate-2-kinase
MDRMPAAVEACLREGLENKREETPRELPNCRNHIIGDNRMALDAMASRAEDKGLIAAVVTDRQQGRPEKVAEQRAREIMRGEYADADVVLLGGETTPVLPDEHGKGGRNQHYAAATMAAMSKYPAPWALASLGTDGSDYLAGIAGAIVDDESIRRAADADLDVEEYIRRYDTYNLFRHMGISLIRTGETGTNVCDVIVYSTGRCA